MRTRGDLRGVSGAGTDTAPAAHAAQGHEVATINAASSAGEPAAALAEQAAQVPLVEPERDSSALPGEAGPAVS